MQTPFQLDAFKIETSGKNQDGQGETIKFMFKPALSIHNDLKLHMEVKYPAQYEISP